MTRKAKPIAKENGGFAKNRASQKRGLHRSILDMGWHQFEIFLRYKARHAGKAVYKVSPQNTS